MAYNKKSSYFLSTNKKNRIKYFIYTPICRPRAVIQISHGMCEYMERYSTFVQFMTDHGFIVCGHNHLGHKGSSPTINDLGFFGFDGGWKTLVMDLAKMTSHVKKCYPDLPLFLLGHSMGSFIARVYLTKYSHSLDGVILCGTSGTNPLLYPGRFLIRMCKVLKGPKFRSPFLQMLMFGTYNMRYPDHKTNMDWICGDEKIVEKYLLDPFCIFIFTTSGFLDLTKLLSVCSSGGWYKAYPKNLPTLITGGEMDPVGQYGKGLQRIYRKLSKQSVQQLSLRIYPNYRHEILNEKGKDCVYEDILAWLEIFLFSKKIP